MSQPVPILYEQQRLAASDGNAGDKFGYSVDMDANLAVIGALAHDTSGQINAGTAYVFESVLDSGLWIEVAKLTTRMPTEYDVFGSFVALRRHTIFVSASGEKTGEDQRGAVYIFGKNQVGHWIETQKLQNPEPPTLSFGGPLAACNESLVIGAFYDSDKDLYSGAVYVYQEYPPFLGVWTQAFKLTASDAGYDSQFGRSVAIADDVLVVGALYDTVEGVRSGSVYVFERLFGRYGPWTEVQKLEPPDPAEYMHFGIRIAHHGDWVVVGADTEGEDLELSGAVYLYRREDEVWKFHSKLKAPDASPGDRFGVDVEIEGHRLLVGAYRDRQGAAYIFEFDSGGDCWVPTRKLRGSRVAGEGYFGTRLAMDGNRLLSTAMLDGSANGYRSGTAYAFDLGIFVDGFESGDTSAWSDSVP